MMELSDQQRSRSLGPADREASRLRARLVPELQADPRRAAARRPRHACSSEQDGLACARRFGQLMDALVASTHDAVLRISTRPPTRPPPSASRWWPPAATAAARMAPGSDIDLLFLLPYKQTAWTESVVEAMLYVLWDLKLKVGHATRSVDECLREAHADMTIRTALLEARLIVRRRGLFDELVARFDKEVVQRHRAREFVAAKLAERDARVASAGASRYLVEPNVKDGKGGLRDLQHPVLDRQVRLPGPRAARSSSRPACSRAEEYRLFARCEEFLWRCAATCISSPGGPRSGSPSTCSALIAERLGYAGARRPVGGRALHEALFPRRQGRRRPDRHRLRRARGAPGQARARARPADRPLAPARAARTLESRRLRRRQRPHERRARGRVRARSGQPDPPVLARRPAQPADPSRCQAAGHALAEADRGTGCATIRRRTGCSSTSCRRATRPRRCCGA